MASLIPGFEYDIFISYRQKDNKGDRWVSEFVEALKTELASAFKEEISVYFDVNPHDGLLDTHDVDASLKEKLRCAIFIPVLSRTYCDPNSFAWKNEFRAFVRQASSDQYGLKVRIPDGRILNRVFPVHIHDLENNDIKLCESVLGEAAGGVEFIYKSAEINRPLRQKEDNPGGNLNKTFYRDQINKTALTIKKIIIGMNGDQEVSPEGISEQKVHKRGIRSVVESLQINRKKLLIGSGILFLLIIAGIFAYTKIFRSDNLKRLISKDGRIPIAVMPFENMTGDTSLNYLQVGMQSNLITDLSNSEELKVNQYQTMSDIFQNEGLTNYASLTPSAARLISKKLDVTTFVQGNIKQSGSTIRLSAQLFDVKTGEGFKSFQVDASPDDLLPVMDTLSRRIREFLIISTMKKNLENSDIYYQVDTRSLEAFRHYIYGEMASVKGDHQTALAHFMRAAETDTNFYVAYSYVSFSYMNLGLYEKAKKWMLKAYNKSKLHSKDISDNVFMQWWYDDFFKDYVDPFVYLKQLIDLNDQEPTHYVKAGYYYGERKQYDKAVAELEKAMALFKKWGRIPDYAYVNLSNAYEKAGRWDKLEKLFKTAEKKFPDNFYLLWNHAVYLIHEGDTAAAGKYIEKFVSILREGSENEASIADAMAGFYSEAGSLDKAEKYLRQALALEPERTLRMRVLAWFLIENDRNVKEGLELIDKALEIVERRLDNEAYRSAYCMYLDIKGWGLYKQGNYKEALEVLRKAWDVRPVFNYLLYHHLNEAKKALAG